MLRAVLLTTWRWTRWPMVIVAVLAFANPVLTVAYLGGLDLRALPVRDVLSAFTVTGSMLILAAFVAAMTAAVSGWGVDATLGYVYLLVLPVPRWYVVLLRFTAGLIVLGVPVGALLLGNLVVALFGTPPELIRAYPFGLAVRFAAACGSFYAVFFALGALSRRPDDTDARKLLVAVAGGVAALIGGLWLDKNVFHDAISTAFVTWMSGPWSPVALFLGRWGLFDV